MFLHAKHAADQGQRVIIIKYSDTYVEILVCHLQKYVSATVLTQSGRGSHTRLVDTVLKPYAVTWISLPVVHIQDTIPLVPFMGRAKTVHLVDY